MGDAEVTASNWRLVEVGRVVYFSTGPYAGRVAAIVQIIDHKRVCESRIIIESRRKWQRTSEGRVFLKLLTDAFSGPGGWPFSEARTSRTTSRSRFIEPVPDRYCHPEITKRDRSDWIEEEMGGARCGH